MTSHQSKMSNWGFITVAVRYEWDNEDRIILYVYVEYPWTWKEYLETARVLKKIIDDLDHPCATIVDTTKFGSLPKDGNAIQVLLKIDKLLSDNIFATALVGAPYGIIVFLNMMMKLRPRLQDITFFTQTLDEARTKIFERYDQMHS
jgi:hypothetical protein